MQEISTPLFLYLHRKVLRLVLKIGDQGAFHYHNSRLLYLKEGSVSASLKNKAQVKLNFIRTFRF